MILSLKGDIKILYFVKMNLSVKELIRMCATAQLSTQLGLIGNLAIPL